MEATLTHQVMDEGRECVENRDVNGDPIPLTHGEFPY
jgi:hypothetical protein